MIRGKCPICRKTFEIEKIGDLPSFPFCADRCRMVDLGRWIDGDYAIPSGKAGPEPTPEDDDEGEKDE